MQQGTQSNTGAAIGTIGGTLTSIIFGLPIDDMIKTSTLAALGAVVSFFVSVGLKCVVKRFRR